MLKLTDLHAYYGKSHVLHGVTFDVGAGEIVSLLGRNGSGRSTTVKAIMGLVESSGSVRWREQELRGKKAFEIARLGLGYVPEDRRIFSDLTVMENLEVGRRPVRAEAPAWTAEKLFRVFPNLGEMPDRLGGRMSGGEQQMLTLARTLIGNPLLVLLDEPSEGIAPRIVEDMANMILELKKEGLSVLLSEQNLHFARLVCDRAYVIEKGQVRFEGTMSELAGDERVKREYLSV
jgi:branched-chain amino acid transport system ATP-binding protein